MNVLIITTYFVPDTAIAGVRPYMLARYLAKSGDNVTVLRAGTIHHLAFHDYDESNELFEVISALGSDCDAEKFKRGEYTPPQNSIKLKHPQIPLYIRVPLRFFRDCARTVFLHKPPRFLEDPMHILEAQKSAIRKMQDKQFDVVFSTYGDLENIQAGIFAADFFHAKLMMDYRDSPVIRTEWMDIARNREGVKQTKLALKCADCVTAVSDALAEEIRSFYPETTVRTVYNGFDDTVTLPNVTPEAGVLTICYTGVFYIDRVAALRTLTDCISDLIGRSAIDRERVRFHYAGSDANVFRTVLEKAGIADLFVDHGYLSKQETLRLQATSDVFLVLSWNHRKSQGILTGKFYEGIRAGKPILACVSGNQPDSELMQLQKQYNYGFCFEQARAQESRPALETYLEQLYREKMENGKLSYQPSAELYGTFSYSSLSKKIRQIMTELVHNP